MPFPYVFPFYFEPCPIVYRVTVTVRIAFADDMFDTTPTWTDVSSDVLEVHTLRGRKHELDRMEAGTCVIILDNASGDYYPDNAGGAYFGNIKTMKRVNIRASYGGATTVDVFTGYVESWTPDWLGKSGKGPTVRINCSDALKVFSRNLLNNAGEAAELSGTRVGNVADEVSWPAAWRDIDTGQETLQATGAQANVNALNHLHLLQESELSLVYIAPDNDLQFEDRSHRTNAPHDAALAVFGDDTGEERYEDVNFVLDEALLFNDVRMTRIGGAEQTSSNATSQTNYGKRSLSRTGLLNNSDIATEILSDFLVARYAQPASRVKYITLRPGRNPGSIWYKALNFEVSDRITIRLNQASVDSDYFIEGIAHDWIAHRDEFTTRWQLSDATQQLNPPDAKEEIIRPNANGDTNAADTIFPDTGETNYEDVDEVVADDDTTYVACNNNPGGGELELYELENPAYGVGTINSVKLTIRTKQIGGAGASLELFIKTGGSTFGGGIFVPALSWTEYTETWTVNPDTTNAWSWAEINALQAGAHLNPNTAIGITLRLTQVFVTVNFTPTW